MRNPLDVRGQDVRIETERISVAFSAREGELVIEDPARRWPTLDHCQMAVDLDGVVIASQSSIWLVDEPERVEDAHGTGTRCALTSEEEGGVRQVAELCAYDRGPVLLRLGVQNTGAAPRRVRSLSLVHEGGARGALLRPTKRWRWLRHGWQSWTPTLSIGASQRDIEAGPPVNAPQLVGQRRGELASDEVGVLLDSEAGRSLLLGFVSARQHWTQVQVDSSRRTLRAVSFADSVPIAPGETVWAERLLLEFADEPEPSLRRYAETLASEMGARVSEKKAAGWCSWYYFFTTVTEADILRNLRFLEQHRREVPVELVQIDDGYQADIGDWTIANEKFPRGMAAMARDVKDAGFMPGIWLAPLLAGEHSRLYAEHSDWVIYSEDEQPALAMQNWGQRNFGLDCSNPDVPVWLEGLFREVTDGWGYEYVKVDFLYGAAIAGRRHDERSTRVDSYRKGLAAMRNGVGRDRFILGCGALMGASVGIVDAQRIGPDVAPWWQFRPRGTPARRGRGRVGGEPAAENAIRNILTRSWMNGRLWLNDPDCLLARQSRTKLSLAEVRSLATAIALSGGAAFLSDDMEQLAGARLDLVSAILPGLRDPVAVSDLLAESMPSTMTAHITRKFESWLVVARFNWEGRRRDLKTPLPPGRWHAFEFWEQRYLGLYQNELGLNGVPPHGVGLVSLRLALDRPQVVGSSFHVSMGGEELASAEWDPKRNVLALDLRPVALRRGRIFVNVPTAFRLSTAILNGTDVSVRSSDALLDINLTIESLSALEIALNRA